MKYCDIPQNHWFTYNETLTVESVTQAVSNLALQFGEEDADPGAMVSCFTSYVKNWNWMKAFFYLCEITE